MQHVTDTSRCICRQIYAEVACSVRHTVRSGDTCDTILTGINVSPTLLRHLNPGFDCEAPRPGQELCLLRTLGCSNAHIVRDGDTCSAIAQANGISIAVLQRINRYWMNPGLNCSDLISGQTMCLSQTGDPLIRLASTAPGCLSLCIASLPNLTRVNTCADDILHHLHDHCSLPFINHMSVAAC
jgi:hypothetical protein